MPKTLKICYSIFGGKIMSEYCVNKFADHLVHNVEECDHLPPELNRFYIEAVDDSDAMEKAKAIYAKAEKCFYCLRHRR